MLGLPAHAHPATARLQLLDQNQQFFPGVLRKDGAGDVDDVGLEELHQGKVFQEKPGIASQASGDAASESDVGGQQIDPDCLRTETQGGGKDHLAAAAAQVIELFAFLQSGQPANLQARKVGRLAEAEVCERAI
jgi:hypothetical protein